MGLLIVPCHTWSNVDDENPVFDVRETKPCVGLLPDLFRRREGVVRTLHPTHSLCVYGPRAQAFAEGQERFDTPCAPGSCYGELLRQNAQVIDGGGSRLPATPAYTASRRSQTCPAALQQSIIRCLCAIKAGGCFPCRPAAIKTPIRTITSSLNR